MNKLQEKYLCEQILDEIAKNPAVARKFLRSVDLTTSDSYEHNAKEYTFNIRSTTTSFRMYLPNYELKTNLSEPDLLLNYFVRSFLSSYKY